MGILSQAQGWDFRCVPSIRLVTRGVQSTPSHSPPAPKNCFDLKGPIYIKGPPVALHSTFFCLVLHAITLTKSHRFHLPRSIHQNFKFSYFQDLLTSSVFPPNIYYHQFSFIITKNKITPSINIYGKLGFFSYH